MTSPSVFPWRQAPPDTPSPFQSSWCWQRCRGCSTNCKPILPTLVESHESEREPLIDISPFMDTEYSIHSGVSSWILRCVGLLIKQTVFTPSRILRRVIAIFDAAEVDESDSDAALFERADVVVVKSTFTEAFIKIHKSHSKRVVNRINKIQMEFVNLTLVKRWSSSSCGRWSGWRW